MKRPDYETLGGGRTAGNEKKIFERGKRKEKKKKNERQGESKNKKKKTRQT